MSVTGRLALCFSILALAACSAAPIAVPPQLAGAERLEITGMGFGERGSLAIGNSSGTFHRQALENRRRDLDSYPARVTTFVGDSGFEMRGPDFRGSVAAACKHFEQEAGTRGLSVTTEPFHYRCLFMRDGQFIPGELVLHAAPKAAGPLTVETRTGRFSIEGKEIAIEPIHHSPGLRVPTGDPLGYRFVSANRDVGAVDLNGERKTVYALGSGDEREAVLMASLALSVLWRN